MKIFSFAVAMSLASVVATTARASEPEPRIGPPEAATTSYGYQPLIGDVVATTLTAAGIVKALSEIGPIDLCGTFSGREDDCAQRPARDHTASTALLATGVATYFLASPIIHAAHGHWGKAALSLGLRAAPIALAAPLLANEDTSGAGGLVLLGGIGAAMAIDWVVIANEETEPAAPARGFSLSPTFDARNGGAGLAAVGTF